MSIFNEIRVLAPRVIKNADKIVEGVSTNIKSKLNLVEESKEQEIQRRRVICKNCPFNSINAKQKDGAFDQLIRAVEKNNGVQVADDIDLSYKTSRADLHCSLCGCNIENKTSCLSCNCGAKDFNESNNTNVEVFWTSFN